MIVSLAITLLVAGQTSPGPTPTQAVAAPVVEKPICRRETPTGSNFSRNVCHTKAEWAAINGENARALQGRRNGSLPH